jgi:hypothetical protein
MITMLTLNGIEINFWKVVSQRDMFWLAINNGLPKLIKEKLL